MGRTQPNIFGMSENGKKLHIIATKKTATLMGEHEIFPAGFKTRLTGYDAKCKLQNFSQLAELQFVEGLIWLA